MHRRGGRENMSKKKRDKSKIEREKVREDR
jgi:hypothetical protein